MDRIQKIILISIISIAVISWVLSKDQPDMMVAMMNYNPVAISLFTISWTIGMAAMMFPAITPMVLLYTRLIKRSNSSSDGDDDTVGKGTASSQYSIFVERGDDDADKTTKRAKRSSLLSVFTSSVYIIFFVGSYLLVWAVTGIVLLLIWSIPANYLFTHFEIGQQQNRQLQIVYGIVLVIAAVYQFSSLKTKCLRYCESPLSFFMRRWRSGSIGAIRMGTYHGLYCLGCCWPYFLIMVALGWMNILWMALFAGIIFGEKMWLRGGIWIAKCTGIGLAVIGIMAMLGFVAIPAGMNNMGDNNGMHTGNLSQNHMKDNMIGINQNVNNTSSSTKGDNTITTEKMSNMKGM
jgi:predicted metal-binding membrane protein